VEERIAQSDDRSCQLRSARSRGTFVIQYSEWRLGTRPSSTVVVPTTSVMRSQMLSWLTRTWMIPNVLYLGPDATGAILEVMTAVDERGQEIVFHAMPMRNKYRGLLP